MIITVHSYKGGTGKTLLSVNLAVMFANRGKKTCLLDLDFRAPSLHVIFKTAKSEYWLNDYLNRACELDIVLKDCSSNCAEKEKLFVGLANPSTEAIREMASKNRKWEMEALCRLLALKESVVNESSFDYMILDSSPGLEYCSINAVVCADVVLVVTTLDESDLEGTKRMIEELYKICEKKTAVVLNKVPYRFLPIDNLERKLESLHLPIVGAIPCLCDIPEAGEYFFVIKKPYHVFTKIIQKVATRIA